MIQIQEIKVKYQAKTKDMGTAPTKKIVNTATPSMKKITIHLCLEHPTAATIFKNWHVRKIKDFAVKLTQIKRLDRLLKFRKYKLQQEKTSIS